MPELPEVETVRRGLLSQLKGKSVKSVSVLRTDSIGYPRPEQFAKALTGRKFVDIERRGKYLIFVLDQEARMVAHLRMSGRLLVTKSGKSNARDSHIRVRIELSNGEALIFEDMRVFGRLWYLPQSESIQKQIPGLAELGPEPLDGLSAKYLKQVFANRSQAIKTALLDQTLIAGIGNIYADESLHLAGIHPLSPARELNLPQLKKLSETIVDVLSNAINLGGSTLRNYTDSSGVNGNYQSQAHVYGRHGGLCHTCKTKIARLKIGGRSSHFCPRCQKDKNASLLKAAKPKSLARSRK